MRDSICCDRDDEAFGTEIVDDAVALVAVAALVLIVAVAVVIEVSATGDDVPYMLSFKDAKAVG